MADSLVGKRLGPYTIEAELGRGGMAVVYRAYEQALKRYVAIKVVSAELTQTPEFLDRFRREARAIAGLQHPNILPVFSLGEDQGLIYIAMMFVAGRTLRDYLANRPPLSETLPLVEQVANALDYGHKRGIIHRDVKPANVLLREGSDSPVDGPWALLSDFGIAKMVQEAEGVTQAGAVIGTADYMSPEQWQGLPLDGRSDVYSLGIMLYQVVTGQLPFKSETPLAAGYLHVNTPLPPPKAIVKDLPGPLESIIRKATAKKPEDRYATAGDFAQALADFNAKSGNRQLAIALPSSERVSAAAAEVGTAVRGATEVVGDRLRDVGAVAGRAGQTVGDVASKVVRVDWPGAALFVARRFLSTILAFVTLAIGLYLVQVLVTGESRFYSLGGQVSSPLFGAFGATFELLTISGLIGAFVGTALIRGGVIAGRGSGCLTSSAVAVGRATLVLLLATPAYVLAATFVIPEFALNRGPVTWVPWNVNAGQHISAMLAPVACLGLVFAGLFTQRLREELALWRRIEWRFLWARRPAFVVSLVAMPFVLLAPIFSILIVVESVFEIPGIGATLFDVGSSGVSETFGYLAWLGFLVLTGRFVADLLRFFQVAFSYPEGTETGTGQLPRQLSFSNGPWLLMAAGMLGLSVVIPLLSAVLPGTGPFGDILGASGQTALLGIAGAAIALVGGLANHLASLAVGGIQRVGAWLSDLLLVPAQALAAVPVVGLLLAEVFIKDGINPAVGAILLTAVALGPRAALAFRATSADGVRATLAGIAPVFCALIAGGIAGQATVSWFFATTFDNRLGTVLRDVEPTQVIWIVIFGTITTLTIAGWIAVSDALSGVRRRVLPWSEVQP